MSKRSNFKMTRDAQTEPLANSGSATFGNAQFQLTLANRAGLEVKLHHPPSGLVLADGAYSYSFGAPIFERIATKQEGDTTTITMEGLSTGCILVRQKYRIPAGHPWIEEQITIENPTSHVLALPNGRCGFVLPLALQGGTLAGSLRDFRFTAVPYRREPNGDRKQYSDYTVAQVLTEPCGSRLRSNYQPGRQETLDPAYASEGWIFTDGGRGFLITKYSQEGMEWAVLDRVPCDPETINLRWGGFGIFQADPEHGAWLAPGGSHSFGTTRITAYQGGMIEGFYTFRSEMEARGHGCPGDFNPPIHWNELYDNKLLWLPQDGQHDPENRKKYYSLSDMKEEAAKAKDIGCEALYLDPGWDTSFASKIWGESRLGKLKDFVEMLRHEYGLSLSLHTPLSGWCNPASYSTETDLMNRDGSRPPRASLRDLYDSDLCGASRQYLEETAARLDALARDGATFFMFDGTNYHGECWDPNHGHCVPARRQEHVEATNRLARLVHARHPNVLIEMHDQMLSGTNARCVPTYYGYGTVPPGEGVAKVQGFDSIWAFELMWDPMTDLVGGNSIVLYYYNLAYSVPLYIHIDLRKDNAQALMFWWNASTCRHLGIGGTHKDSAVQEAQKAAMALYRRLKPFFAAGTFYGIDELTHVHRHPTEPAVVINCFNLEDHPEKRQFEFAPARFGLDDCAYEFKGAQARRVDGKYLIDVEIPSYGHCLIEARKLG
ncbi:MAG: hypothetical protein V1800_08055 [Candidatus Latescibacterota bacterium]